MPDDHARGVLLAVQLLQPALVQHVLLLPVPGFVDIANTAESCYQAELVQLDK